jgi:hypothetical protein
MFPAVLVLLNVPISIDKCNDDTVFPLDNCLYVLLKLIGLINALQFRRASNLKTKWVKETQQDLILRTMSQDGDSSFT